jgi:hypothetical protein
MESLKCARQLIFTLDSISQGTGISEALAKRIKGKYGTLQDADYKGGLQTSNASLYS